MSYFTGPRPSGYCLLERTTSFQSMHPDHCGSLPHHRKMERDREHSRCLSPFQPLSAFVPQVIHFRAVTEEITQGALIRSNPLERAAPVPDSHPVAHVVFPIMPLLRPLLLPVHCVCVFVYAWYTGDLMSLCVPFGPVDNLLQMRPKNQALPSLVLLSPHHNSAPPDAGNFNAQS